jgi:hypothetical protein
MRHLLLAFVLLGAAAAAPSAAAQPAAQPAARSAASAAAPPAPAAPADPPPPALDGDGFAARFSLLGQLQPRPASRIADNAWSVGAEAIDRDYSTYAAWRAYLGPLGAKRARLQSGWARTDLGGGRYDFAWLDPIVDDMRAQGVRPWLSLSYGNERYPGGGTGRRDSPLPSGAGRDAWLAYVRATAARYRGRVAEYEVWNEPDLNARVTGPEYGRFAYETARAIKGADPAARVFVGTFASAVWDDPKSPRARDFARAALDTLVKLGGRGYVAGVTYHSYSANPDAVYASVPSFLALVRGYDPGLEVRQGENGAPSLNQQHYALRNLWWTEESQAKWLLRRMLGDAARGIPTSVFSITEMHYPVAAETNLGWVDAKGGERPAAASSKHFKGLLETRRYAPGTPDDDRTVVRTKMGYVAMQGVTSIFDAALRPVDAGCTARGPAGPVSVHAFRRADGAAVVAVWRSGDVPGARPQHELADVVCPGLAFGAEPRYVDLLTRAAYATRGVVAREGAGVRITGLPVYDAPVLVADAALVDAR